MLGLSLTLNRLPIGVFKNIDAQKYLLFLLEKKQKELYLCHQHRGIEQ